MFIHSAKGTKNGEEKKTSIQIRIFFAGGRKRRRKGSCIVSLSSCIPETSFHFAFHGGKLKPFSILLLLLTLPKRTNVVVAPPFLLLLLSHFPPSHLLQLSKVHQPTFGWFLPIWAPQCRTGDKNPPLKNKMAPPSPTPH